MNIFETILERKKILLVEDDLLISQAYRFALGEAGFDVLLADDGKEALEKIKAEKPDLVLLDVIMPLVNGFEVLERLKKRGMEGKPPVIMISNLGQAADIARGKKLGAVDFLVKSNISLKSMVETVKNFMES
ncbi:MAG: response regulator [Patescibacteria group bacterium]